jgi:NDP-sugar pyrophosphorylase family protein
MDELGDGSRYGVRIRYSVEEELLDSGGGIRHAARLFGDEPVVVLNSDIICDVPIRDVVRFHEHERSLVTLVLRDDPDARRYGLFGVDPQSRIRRFLGESLPDLSQAPLRDYMFASVQVLDPAVIRAMPEGRPFSTMREFYPALFRSGASFCGYVYPGPWLTVDTRSDLERAEADLAAAGLPSYMENLPPGDTTH